MLDRAQQQVVLICIDNKRHGKKDESFDESLNLLIDLCRLKILVKRS